MGVEKVANNNPEPSELGGESFYDYHSEPSGRCGRQRKIPRLRNVPRQLPQVPILRKQDTRLQDDDDDSQFGRGRDFLFGAKSTSTPTPTPTTTHRTTHNRLIQGRRTSSRNSPRRVAMVVLWITLRCHRHTESTR